REREDGRDDYERVIAERAGHAVASSDERGADTAEGTPSGTEHGAEGFDATRREHARLERLPRGARAPAASTTPRRARAAGHDADPGAGRLRLLLVFLLRGRGALVLRRLGHALLELLDAGAERARQLGQAIRAEKDQDDHEDQQQLLILQAKHENTPFSLRRSP